MSLSSIAASAKRALNANKARKGDVICIQVDTVVTYAFGSGRGNETSTEFHVCRAGHCTTEGKVMEATDIGEYRSKRPEHSWVRCWILPREDQAKFVPFVGRTFATMDEVRAALSAARLA